MSLEKMLKTPSGFLTDMMNIMIEKIPRINKAFAFQCSESLLSSCCFNIKTLDAEGDVYIVIWNMSILPSGLGVKSLPIKHWVIPIMKKVQEKDPTHPLMISHFNVESHIKFMNWHSHEVYNEETKEYETVQAKGNVGLIPIDEWTQIQKGFQTKDYMSDVPEHLSEVYDTSIGNRVTITHGFQTVDKCIKAFLSATTPFVYKVWNEDFFVQGLGNRLDYVVVEESGEEKIINHEEFFRRIKHEEILEPFAIRLRNLIESPINLVWLDDEAQKFWVNYEKGTRDRIKKLESRDLKRAYLARQAEKVLKRAALYTVSRNMRLDSGILSTDEENLGRFPEDTPGELICSKDDLNLAIQSQEFYFANFCKMLENWRSGRRRAEYAILTDETIRDTISAIIQREGVASRQLIIDETRLNEGNKKLTDTISSLWFEKKIETMAGQESRDFIAKQTQEWKDRQHIKNFRGIAPVLHKWIGESE